MAVESGGQRVAFTHDRVEELLRPELEDGTITWNDFERTKRFASINRTYWPTVTGTLSAASIVYYGHWYRRRPWSKLSFLLIAPIAYAVGTFPGALAQMLAVRRFRRDLEDPNGLVEALGRRVRLISQTARESNQVQESYLPGSGDPESNFGSHDQADPLKGRWEEIREASTPASRSTWDNIRQVHERPPESRPPQSDARFEEQGDRDRQTEQANFDALLEAERKVSS